MDDSLGVHLSFVGNRWANNEDEARDWTGLSPQQAGGSDESFFARSQKLARVFLAVGFATLERSRPEISEASYGKAESVLRALEEEILTVQGNTDDILSDDNGSVTFKANHLEVAYRASYRRTLLAIHEFCFYCSRDYHSLLQEMKIAYPTLLDDFPKCESDVNPIDLLEQHANVVYGPPPPILSYIQQIKMFFVTKGKMLLPPLIWIPEYDWKHTLFFDILAGLTIGVFLVPQAMAYAVLAGLPVEIGLYASTVPVLVYSILGTSRQMAVGPFALVALLVAGAISSLPPASNPANQVAQNIQASANLMLYVAVILIVFGILRLGFIANFISKAFLAGFTSASGIIIQTGQIPGLMGEKVVSNFQALSWIEQVIEIVRKLPTVHWPTLLVGLVTLAIVIGLEQINRSKPIVIKGTSVPIPSSLVVIVLGILISYLANFSGLGIKVVGFIPPGFNKVVIPSFDQFGSQFVNAIIISLIVFLSSASIAVRYADLHHYDIDSSQEQLALGFSNLAGAFLPGFVVCGAMSRSAVANAAGARSPLFGIFSALIVIIAILVATSILSYLPSACLSAMIFVAAYGLWDHMLLMEMWRIRKLDFVVFIVSYLSTLFLGSSIGLLVALGFSLIVVVYAASRPHIAILGRLPRTTVWRNVFRFPDALVQRGLLVVRIDADFFFANIRFIHDSIIALITNEKQKVHVLLLDMSVVAGVDFSAVVQLQATMKWLKDREIHVMATGINGKVRDVLRKAGFLRLLGEDNVYWTHADAVRVAKEIIHSRGGDEVESEEKQIKARPQQLERDHSVFGGDAHALSFHEQPKKQVSFWQRLI